MFVVLSQHVGKVVITNVPSPLAESSSWNLGGAQGFTLLVPPGSKEEEPVGRQ